MYIFLTDETNQQQSQNCNFFVYGGLFFPIEVLDKLDEKISIIRRETGYRPEDILKFDTHSRPEHVLYEKATEAKSRTIDTCIELGCKFIVYIILHDIIKNQDAKQYILWAADYVFGRFNYFLENVANDTGICVIDNLPVDIQYKYLSDKFSKGLVLHDGRTVALPCIKLFASTCVGASHANSAMDIVLGSFRYCINNPQNIEAARGMMKKVVSLMWHKKEGDTIYVSGMGLIIRPKLEEIEPSAKDEYNKLIRNINELIKGNNC